MTASGAVTSWSGWEVRGGKSAEPGAAEAFAKSTPRSGAEARYEIIAVAARGFRPPRFLSALEIAESGPTDISDNTERIGDADYEGLRRVWSLLYRCVAETAPAVVVPDAIYLLGVNAPPEATDDELGVFNDFYTNVHLREVAERHHALRAVRYELVSVVQPPYPSAPRFLAVYELDEKAASVRRHVGPPYATGPDVWQRHTTPWRLWYRRLVAALGTDDLPGTAP